jgi:hypothetical protein
VKLVIRTNGLPLRDTCPAAGLDQTSQSDRFGAGAATGGGGPVFGLKAITLPTVSNSLGRDSRRLAGQCGSVQEFKWLAGRPRFLLNSATLTIAPLGAWPD